MNNNDKMRSVKPGPKDHRQNGVAHAKLAAKDAAAPAVSCTPKPPASEQKPASKLKPKSKPADQSAAPQAVAGNDSTKKQPGWANSLRQLYDSVLDEPLPDSFHELLKSMDEKQDDK